MPMHSDGGLMDLMKEQMPSKEEVWRRLLKMREGMVAGAQPIVEGVESMSTAARPMLQSVGEAMAPAGAAAERGRKSAMESEVVKWLMQRLGIQ